MTRPLHAQDLTRNEWRRIALDQANQLTALVGKIRELQELASSYKDDCEQDYNNDHAAVTKSEHYIKSTLLLAHADGLLRTVADESTSKSSS